MLLLPKMGKNATYRKRGSITPSALLPPPGPSDWETRFDPDNFEVRFLVVAPPLSPFMITRYSFGGDSFSVGLSGNVKDAWFAICEDTTGDPATIQVAWASGPTHATRTSEWSASKIQAP